jgi:hypothetical protein
MPGAGYNLQSLPGYVGNNPVNPMLRPMNAFEMYNPAEAMQQRQQQQERIIIPRRPEDMNPPPPPNEPKIYIHDPPLRVVADPPVVLPPLPPVVQPPPVVQTPTPPTNYEQAQQAHAIVQASQPAVEAPKSSTATVVGIGAAGILAALLFK